MMYWVECRHCDGRYVGRIAELMSAHIKQHVTIWMLSKAATRLRPRRGKQTHTNTVDPVSITGEHTFFVVVCDVLAIAATNLSSGFEDKGLI